MNLFRSDMKALTEKSIISICDVVIVALVLSLFAFIIHEVIEYEEKLNETKNTNQGGKSSGIQEAFKAE